MSGEQDRSHQKRSEATRAKLIAAGMEIFAAKGFEGATTRAIAQKAEVALASLPYHFRTKEALWKAAANDIFGRFAERMALARAKSKDLGSREQTRFMLSEYIRFTAEHPELLQIVLQEGISPNPRTNWLVENHIRPNFEYMKSETTRAVANGYGRSGRADHLYYMIVGSSALPYVMANEFKCLTDRNSTDPDLIDAHVDAMLDLFYPPAEDPQD
jgi:AcrR family transcriptional regulator